MTSILILALVDSKVKERSWKCVYVCVWGGGGNYITFHANSHSVHGLFHLRCCPLVPYIISKLNTAIITFASYTL